MSKKIVLISDVHIGVRNDNPFYMDKQLKFFENQFIPYFENNSITDCFILGDLFDRRKYVNFNTLYEYKRRVFDVLENKSISVHILVGNHDTAYKNTNKVNSPELLLSEYENVTIYTNPQTVPLLGIPVAVVPWVNIENYNEFLKYSKDSPAKIMFGHFEIKDFYMYANSIKCEHGFDRSFFDKYDMVLSGHFHEQSQIDNIRYLGSPSEFNWNDAECDRGFHILDLETQDLTFEKNYDTIHHRLYYEDNFDLMEFDFNLFRGQVIKLIVNEKADQNHYDLFVNAINSVNPESFDIVDNTEYQFIDDSDIDEDALKSENLTSIVDSYIDLLDTQLDKGKIKKMFNSLYEMVESKDD